MPSKYINIYEHFISIQVLEAVHQLSLWLSLSLPYDISDIPQQGFFSALFTPDNDQLFMV